MMREILFRGKRLGGDEWVHGCLFVFSDGVVEISNLPESSAKSVSLYQVDPDTVGQYIGLTDAHGRRIWEGDILKKHGYDKGYWVVSFCEGAFEVVGPLCCGSFRDDYSVDNFEVVGNIHDNPELLEVTHEI